MKPLKIILHVFVTSWIFELNDFLLLLKGTFSLESYCYLITEPNWTGFPILQPNIPIPQMFFTKPKSPKGVRAQENSIKRGRYHIQSGANLAHKTLAKFTKCGLILIGHRDASLLF